MSLGAGTLRCVGPTLLVPFSRLGIARRSAPFLPHDAVIRHLFCAQVFSPWWRFPPWGLLYVSPVMGYRVVAVADDAIYILAASRWLRWHPKRLLRTLPRHTTFGPLRGPWTRLALGSESAWVFGRFYGDVRASDADVPLTSGDRARPLKYSEPQGDSRTLAWGEALFFQRSRAS